MTFDLLWLSTVFHCELPLKTPSDMAIHQEKSWQTFHILFPEGILNK